MRGFHSEPHLTPPTLYTTARHRSIDLNETLYSTPFENFYALSNTPEERQLNISDGAAGHGSDGSVLHGSHPQIAQHRF